MTKSQMKKIFDFVTSDKCCTDSDLYDFCEKHKINIGEAFHLVSVWSAPECCRTCKNVDLRPSMYPCTSCSRGKPDLYEEET